MEGQRPTRNAQAAIGGRVDHTVRPVAVPVRRVSRRKKTMAIGVIIVILVACAVLCLLRTINQQRIDGSRYQAVYLVTGQIYFGKLQNTHGNFMTLTDAYTAQSQAADTSTSPDKTPAADQTKTSIIKVADQVYGPDNSIALRTDQVLFWQNLQASSKVVKAIESNK